MNLAELGILLPVATPAAVFPATSGVQGAPPSALACSTLARSVPERLRLSPQISPQPTDPGFGEI